MDIRNELQEARACVLSQRQFDGCVLDKRTVDMIGLADFHLTVARKLLRITVDGSDDAETLIATAMTQLIKAATLINEWRGDGLATVVPTTEFEG